MQNLNIKVCGSLCISPSVWSIVQITICLIMMQILYSDQIVTLMHDTVVYRYLHSYKINILILYWISKETILHNSENPYVKCIRHCICHSIKILYIGNEKRVLGEEPGTEELDAQHSAPAHWTVYMYFIACYYELLMLLFISTVTCVIIVNEPLDKYKCNIFWQANKSSFSFVFIYSKRNCCCSSDSRV